MDPDSVFGPEGEAEIQGRLRRYSRVAADLILPQDVMPSMTPGARRRDLLRSAATAITVAVVVVSAVAVGFAIGERRSPAAAEPAPRDEPSPTAQVFDPAGVGVLGAPSCEASDWPVTVVPCIDAERAVSWGSRRIDSTRVWLTTLSDVKAALDPPPQVVEPPDDTQVWVFVYEGKWRGPLYADESGDLRTPPPASRWLYAADAEHLDGTGFIYIHDWSGQPIPERFPRPAG